jgi:hypothetical protein
MLTVSEENLYEYADPLIPYQLVVTVRNLANRFALALNLNIACFRCRCHRGRDNPGYTNSAIRSAGQQLSAG